MVENVKLIMEQYMKDNPDVLFSFKLTVLERFNQALKELLLQCHYWMLPE